MLRVLMLSLTSLLVATTLVIGQDGASKKREKPAARDKQEESSDPIDFNKARELFRKRQAGETLSRDEEAYLRRAMEERRKRDGGAALTPREKTRLVPLSDMTAKDRYKGQDGGLYSEGQNAPPEKHRQAAEAMLDQIQPRDADGKPSDDGRIVFISISMSNATQEFSTFKRIADQDVDKSSRLTIVDCAQGGQTMARWADPQAEPWSVAAKRIANANVTPEQVQVAWIKLANAGPRGELEDHGKKLQRDTVAVLQNARDKFPNLRIAYLSSRIYGGYANTPLNPEPYAYEGAFVVRWLIQDQIKGDKELNFDPEEGSVKSPLLLWGPYLWADGVQPRKNDELVWNRDDLGGDGTHPSRAGQDKVAHLLLDFFKSAPLSRSWFRKP